MENLNLILLLLSITENYILSIFILSILDKKISFKRLTLMSIGVSIFVLSIRTLPVTPVMNIFVAMSAQILLVRYLYGIPILLGGIAAGLTDTIYMTLETILIPLLGFIFNVELNMAMNTPLIRIKFL
ncbi:hypothetical protein [Halothermothrix orenii]|uniref:Uncharacterized protein n=1 Tax=Halothermothrix orenii (strain H 168 / OCM 544 / DSM 9562) TaxID=373903 RepID=B8D0V5_HALOH|nr:hypothetical protein [Halothermothrix orenii]ACL68924.1 hypothetical protein Hore_01620 [Halothermothrix orenii H 168]